MCNDIIKQALQSNIYKNRNTIILIGIETHICALQSALDLIKNGYNVYYVVDAGGSMRLIDENFALKRMENNGVILTTAECIIFQLLKDAKHPKFRNIQKHVKKHIKDLGKYSQRSKL